MIENILTVCISVLCGAVATYVIIKKLVNPIDLTEEIVNFIVSDEEMQKKLVLIGALIGNGIKTGIGLNPKSGKYKFEDLISQVLASFFLPKITGEAQTSEPLQNILERLRGGKTA